MTPERLVEIEKRYLPAGGGASLHHPGVAELVAALRAAMADNDRLRAEIKEMEYPILSYREIAR